MPGPRALLFLLLLPLSLTAATVRVEGESFSELSFEEYVTPRGGEWFRFDNVSFTGATAVVLNAARQGPAVMEFRLGSPTGTKLGQVTVDTGGWRTFQDHTVTLSGVSGPQSLYVVATGAGATAQAVCSNVRLIGATFNRRAIYADTMAPALRDRDYYFVSLQGAWAKYPGKDLGTGVTAVRMHVANGSTGTLTLRRDGITGPVIGTVTSTNTGWRTFTTYTATLAGGSHTGGHDLYLVGSGGHGGVVDWIEFDTASGGGGGSGDTTPPATPAAPSAIINANGTVTLSGTTEAAALVSIRDAGVQIATTTTDAGGQWSTTLTLSAGAHHLSVVVSDASGNTSGASPTTAVTVPAGGVVPLPRDQGGDLVKSCGLGGGLAAFLLLGFLLLSGTKRT